MTQIEIAQAVKRLIEAQGFDLVVSLEYAPQYEYEGLGDTVRAIVQPADGKLTVVSRGRSTRSEAFVEISVMAKCDSADTAKIAGLIAQCEAVAVSLLANRLTDEDDGVIDGVAALEATYAPLYSVDRLREEKIFQGLIQVRFGA